MEPQAPYRRCPACGARNAATAEWCGQCYQRFEPPEGVLGQGALAPEPEGAPPSADRPPAPPGGPDDFRVEEPQWECSACGGLNPVDASNCVSCGTSIFSSFGGEVRGPSVSPSTAAGWSLVFPGLGHQKAGQGLLGFSIGLLTAITLLLGAALGLLFGRRTAGSVLLLVALGLWVVAAADAYRWANGEPGEVLLRPRVVSIVAGGVILLMMVVLAAGSMGSRA